MNLGSKFKKQFKSGFRNRIQAVSSELRKELGIKKAVRGKAIGKSEPS